MSMKLTDRQRDGLEVLARNTAPGQRSGMTPSEFAREFWPGKNWARINGPWGLGPDASGLHGGRMLTRLRDMGLVDSIDHAGGKYWTARINPAGLRALEEDRARRG